MRAARASQQLAFERDLLDLFGNGGPRLVQASRLALVGDVYYSLCELFGTSDPDFEDELKARAAELLSSR